MHSGCRLIGGGKFRLIGFLTILASAGVLSSLLWAQNGSSTAAPRSRVYRFKHITTDQAKAFLAQAGLTCELTELPRNALIVTSTNSDVLIKSSSLFDVVDSTNPYTVTEISVSKTLLESLRTNQVHLVVEGMELGTFTDPPADKPLPRVIVDGSGGQLIVAVPSDAIKTLSAAVRKLEPVKEVPVPITSKPAPVIEPTVPSPVEVKESAAPVQETKDTAPEPVELYGPPAPGAEELASRELPKTPSTVVSDEVIETTKAVEPEVIKTQEPVEKTESGDFFEDELLQSLAKAEQQAPPQDTEGEKKIDEAIDKAVEAEKKAVTAELEAAEAEKKAQEMLKALETLQAQGVVETQATQPVTETKTAEPPQPKQATEPAQEKAEQPEPKSETAKAAPKPAETPKEPAPEPEPAKPAPKPTEEPKTETPKTAAPVPKVGEAAKPAAKPPVKTETAPKPQEKAEATTPTAEEVEKERQAGLQKLLELMAQGKPQQQEATSPPPLPGPTETTVPPKPEPAKAEPPKKIETRPAPLTTEPEKSIQDINEPVIPNGEEELELTITLPEDVEISELVELVGKQLGLNYLYDPTIVKGTVKIKIHDGKIKVRDIYALLEQVLKFKGLVMTRRDKLVTIIRENEAMKFDPAIRKSDEAIEAGDVVVISVFELENISTNTAENMLKSMSLGLTFNSVAETQTLIVLDYAYRTERIREVINLIDVTGQKRLIVPRTLTYTIASKLAPKVQTLAGFLETIEVTVSETPATPTPPTPTRTTTTRTTTTRPPTIRPPTTSGRSEAQTADTVHLDTDDRTNRIFIIGLEDKVKIVEGLIDELDVPEQSLRTIKEYQIQYIDTAEVVEALHDLGVISSLPSTTTSATSPTRSPTTRTTNVRTAVPRPTTTSGDTAEPDDPFISIRESTNSLLINATEEQHAEIALVIAHVDVEQTDSRTIQEYEIQHVDAAEIITTLEELGLVQTQSRSSTYGSTSRYDRSTTSSRTSPTTSRTTPTTAGASAPAAVAPPPAVTGEATTAEDIVADYPQIAILEATNSLLVSATPRQHAAIALIISHVDRELDQISTPFVVYALENQDPEELAGTIGEVVNATLRAQAAQSGAAAAGTTTPTRDAKIETRTRPGATGRRSDDLDITIVPDKATYSLIVYANKKNQQWISELIKTLDDYRPQVLLDVTLVEITKQDDFSYALNVLHSIPDLDHISGLTGVILPGDTPVTSDSILSRLTSASDRNRFIDFQSDSGNFTGFYGDNKIMALLTAMQTKNYGRILAKPKLLVDDNQEGTIETKTTTYITRTRSSTQVPDTGTPFTTTDVTFEPYDASISLGIKPHISQGDNLRLEITLSRSDFLNLDPESEKPPNQAISDVQTVVTVPDNSTIILGGMDKVNQSKGGTKVPILGDIPLLGGLFRTTSNTSAQSKLYIFIKAHILRPGDSLEGRKDLEHISRINRTDFEESENEMQKYEDWPGIKPKPMDPLRVLEEDETLDDKVEIDLRKK
ncbi:MAG: hypothetical protein JXA82_07155 [Sedimentisphaerales bacterium]|nr:hypothetical protein [Sedimentisphaerales bacterium]